MPDGTYKITGTDSLGNQVSTTVVVPKNPPLTCNSVLKANASSAGANDGIISIDLVYGGLSPYTYEVKDGSGSIIVSAGTPLNVALLPLDIIGLAVDTTSGYTVTITDNVGNICATTGITVGGLTNMNVVVTSKNCKCFGDNTGEIDININGGTPPYHPNTTGPGVASSATQVKNLLASTITPFYYTVNVVDSGSNSFSTNVPITQPQEITIQLASKMDMGKQCNPNTYTIPFNITGGISSGTIGLQYSLDPVGSDETQWTWISGTTTYTVGNPVILTLPKGSFTTKVAVNSINSNYF